MKKGFTLIEVMIAVLILSIGLVGIICALGSGIDDIGRSRDISIAAGCLQDEMEIIRNTPFSKLTDNRTDEPFMEEEEVLGLQELRSGEGFLTIEEYGSTEIKKVTLKVTWKGRGEKSHTRRLVTLVTKEGINPK